MRDKIRHSGRWLKAHPFQAGCIIALAVLLVLVWLF